MEMTSPPPSPICMCPPKFNVDPIRATTGTIPTHGGDKKELTPDLTPSGGRHNGWPQNRIEAYKFYVSYGL